MSETLLIVDQSNRAFSHIIEFLLPAILFDSFINVHHFGVMRPWKEDEGVVLTSKVEPRGIFFHPHPLIGDLSLFRLPQSIEFLRYLPSENVSIPGAVDFGKNAYGIIERMSISTVIGFYQILLPTLTQTYGPVEARNETWPGAIKFLRHLRNALAHKGKVTIKSDKDKAVWRGIEIDSSLNGEDILRSVIQIGDIPILLADVGALIPSHAASSVL